MSQQLPNFRQGMTIQEISEAANRYIESEWKILYESMHHELTVAFEEMEDAAYGLYLDRLLPPVFDRLEAAGFSLEEKLEENDFVIARRLIFRNSLEKWGVEDNRSRIFWNVLRDRDGHPIGSLLTEIPHSHLKFDIPSSPIHYALEESGREQIVLGIRRIKE
ncbi:DUF6022 family protein [Cohnella thailandensis]|uniref:Uncharacterized protein n=1 Tax=Cohnella thailandensis TaxID=557557 RepID=A0A841SK72_9BACL|nr:DUF6022 family protein [Cohnella thailandensis]MBB6632923.1 hypothetical protein [Cohnella thailandensis]MBP1975384.1 hypothetical protein [Cohnella thailandensis]